MDPIAKVLLDLLGPTTIAGVASAWIRQWVKGKLGDLEALVAARRIDRQWKSLAKLRLRALEDECDRQAKNAHAWANYHQSVVFAVQTLAEQLQIQVSLPSAPNLLAPRRLTGDDLVKALEAGELEEHERDEREVNT